MLGAKQAVVTASSAAPTMTRWKCNQAPQELQADEDTIRDFTPMLPEKLVTIAQGDFVSMVADLRMLENMGTVNIGLLCEGATHPGGKVLQGAR